MYLRQLISDFLLRSSAEKNIGKLHNKEVHIGCFRWPLYSFISIHYFYTMLTALNKVSKTEIWSSLEELWESFRKLEWNQSTKSIDWQV